MEEKYKNHTSSDEITGIILLNLGGPDSIGAVKPFLYNLFSDRQIIQLGPSFMQKPIAWMISNMRAKKSEQYYRLIGGKSPIYEITRAQAKALEESLNQKSAVSSQQSIPHHPPLTKEGDQEGVFFRVYVGMRYWHPLIEEVIPEIYKNGIKKILALSLYPQYSMATSGSSFSKLKQVVADFPIKIFCVESWFDHPSYINSLVETINEGLEKFNYESEPHVLFSAHSLPRKIIEEGDPYEHQTLETIKEVAKRIQLKWHLGYQSRSGPVKWLEPSTEEKLKELAKLSIKNVLVVPISFVSDHIETLYEIDILYKQIAENLGINLIRAESLNTRPSFIKALKDIVKESLKATELA